MYMNQLISVPVSTQCSFHPKLLNWNGNVCATHSEVQWIGRSATHCTAWKPCVVEMSLCWIKQRDLFFHVRGDLFMTMQQYYGNIDSYESKPSADQPEKEENMLDQQKLTIIYCRLSNEDQLEGESNSIQNQRDILTRYAESHGFTNIKVLVDDGYTGTNFNRPGVKEGLDLVEQGLVGTWIVKDMSRFGRDYLQVGKYTELVFPSHDVRFIAVNDGVDSENGDNDFTPFRNLFNDFYAKDTSKKVKAVMRARGKSGKHLGWPPYGYMCDPDNKDHWIPDPEAAPVVKRIFALAIDGKGPVRIARILEAEHVLTPKALYAKKKGYPLPSKPYFWCENTIVGILERVEYTGCTCNFKTYSRSYKLKKRLPNKPENMLVFPDTQEAIIPQKQWERVQELRENRHRLTKTDRQGLFSGLLFCADCGCKLYFAVRNHCGTRLDRYICSRYKGMGRGRGNCSAHYIREDVLKEIVLDRIRAVNEYIRRDVEGFQKEWFSRHNTGRQACINDKKMRLEKAKKRIEDLDKLISQCYEDAVLGNLSHERYVKMTQGYEEEQKLLITEADTLEKWVENEEEMDDNMDSFLNVVHRYMDVPELSPTIVNEYIKKIIVYAPEKSQGHRQQKLQIIWNFLEEIDIPDFERTAVCQTVRGKRGTA